MGNSLRDNVKDAIKASLMSTGIYDDKDGIVSAVITEDVFDVLKIDSHDQDKADYKVAVSPRVVCQVSGGMITLSECDKNVDVELRDYDIEGFTDEELAKTNAVVDGEFGKYIIR